MKNIITVLQKLLYVSIVIIVIAFCWFNSDSLVKIMDISAKKLLIITLSYFLLYSSNAFCSYYLLNRRSYSAKFIDLLLINCHASVLGYISFFRAGFYAGKLYFYKSFYGVSLTFTLGIISYISVLAIASSVVIGLFTGLIAINTVNEPLPVSYWLILLCSLILIIVLIAGLFSITIFNVLPPRAKKWIQNLQLAFTSTNSKELIVLFCVLSAGVFFQAIALQWLFSGFNIQIEFIYFIFMSVLSNLSLIISITPSNMGIKEVLLLLMLTHLDVSTVDVFSVLVIDRVLQFLMVSLISLSGYKKLKWHTDNPVEAIP